MKELQRLQLLSVTKALLEAFTLKTVIQKVSRCITIRLEAKYLKT